MDCFLVSLDVLSRFDLFRCLTLSEQLAQERALMQSEHQQALAALSARLEAEREETSRAAQQFRAEVRPCPVQV